MSRDGSGNYVSPSNSWNPAVSGQQAVYSDWQDILNDLVAALTQSVSRDGQTVMTGNLQMGGNKITGQGAGTASGQALIYEQLFNQGTEQDLASAATTDIGAQLTNFLRITGSTTITSFGANYKGPRFLRFEGAVTLTNGSALTLPGGANITTAAGDCLIVIPRATLGTADGWQVVAYQSASVNPQSPTLTNLTVTNSINVPNTFGFKNRLINAQGLINQRAVSGTVTLTAGSYGHDRFKAGSSGCTYTFSTSNNVTTFTISAGSLIQVIEGLNLESGSYILSWTGTAQGRVASGTYGASGVTATVVGGTNTSIEFNTGTLSLPQFEKGGVATSFDYRPYGTELALCQRYFEVGDIFPIGYVSVGSNFGATAPFKVTKRASPTIVQTNTSNTNVSATPQQTTITVNSFTSFRTATATGTNQYSETFTISAEL